MSQIRVRCMESMMTWRGIRSGAVRHHRLQAHRFLLCVCASALASPAASELRARTADRESGLVRSHVQPVSNAPGPALGNNRAAATDQSATRGPSKRAGQAALATMRFEAERPLKIVHDPGISGIGTANGELDSGESVKLYDEQDTIGIEVTVPKSGAYRIGARVRAGGPDDATSFWPEGYSFTLDGDALALTGDSATLSELDPSYGGCHWGTMMSEPLVLQKGAHRVEIRAEVPWGVADYIEVLELPRRTISH